VDVVGRPIGEARLRSSLLLDATRDTLMGAMSRVLPLELWPLLVLLAESGEKLRLASSPPPPPLPPLLL
jgi:hypothetical protein